MVRCHVKRCKKNKRYGSAEFCFEFLSWSAHWEKGEGAIILTVGKLPYLCYIFLCACVCVFVCVFSDFWAFVWLRVGVFMFFGGDQQSVCVVLLLILRGLKCLTPVTRFPLRPP